MSVVSPGSMVDEKISKCVTHAEELETAGQEGVEVQLHKVLLVSLADTVVDPRTVVVHLENAIPTLSAVMCSLRLPSFFSWTLLTVFDLLLQLLTCNWCFHSFLDSSWIGRQTSDVGYDLHYVKTIARNE